LAKKQTELLKCNRLGMNILWADLKIRIRVHGGDPVQQSVHAGKSTGPSKGGGQAAVYKGKHVKQAV
jgi:hypothetical protein